MHALPIDNPSLRTIYLHGSLGRKFGFRHRLAVATPREAVTALSVLRKGFAQYFWRDSAHYTFVRGATRRSGVKMNEIEIGMLLGREDFHIVPVTAGAGGGGTGKTVGKIALGVVMIAGAFFTAGGSLAAGAAAAGAGPAATFGASAGAAGLTAAGWGASVGGLGLVTAGQLAGMGAMMALGGISQLLTPTPQASPAKYANLEAAAVRQSFLYNGPANTSEQGGPVPVIYGTMHVGSTLMSASISSEEVPI